MRQCVAVIGLLMATPAGAACTLAKVAELPVTMQGPRPIVPAKINSKDADFLLDSGAFWSVMSAAAADRYGLRREAAPMGLELRGVGGRADVTIATVRELTLVGQPIRNAQFLVGGSDPGGAGVIGQNILGLGDAEYDLAHGVARLMVPKGCGQTNFAYWAKDTPYAVIPIEETTPIKRHTIGTVRVNGYALKAVFDTGAASSVLNLPAAARAGARPDGPGVRPAGMSQGIGSHVTQSWIAPIATFQIGDEQIRNIHLRIGDLGPDLDMLIGADFFLAHHIYVANSQHRLYLTYNGGPVFDLSVKAGAELAGAGSGADQEPADAEAYGRRGAANAARMNYADAARDLTRAIALAPADPHYLVQRAEVYRRERQLPLARTDLDAALALKPDYVPALIASAEMRVHANRAELARRDLDAAAAALSSTADERLELSRLYAAVDAFGPAVEQATLWLDSHRVDGNRAMALNGRCWARALAGEQLERALEDCNAALRLIPKSAGMHESRGMVYFRRHEDDKALADFTAALAADSHLAWSLYGSSLIEHRRGENGKAEASMTAATALMPTIVVKARRYGIAD